MFGAAEAQRSALSMPLLHDEEPHHTHLLVTTRQQLGEDFATAWSAGQAATSEAATNHALECTGFLRLHEFTRVLAFQGTQG